MLDEKMKSLFSSVFELHKQRITLMSQEIKGIIKNKITDIPRIEDALDYLFDLLEYNDALLLYRKLCKYYYDINPQATIRYINYYKKEYDPKGIKFGRKDKNGKN